MSTNPRNLVRGLAPGTTLFFYAPWHFLYFFPDPQGQGSFPPPFPCPRTTCCTGCESPAPAIRACSSSLRLRRMKASSNSSAEVETIRDGRRPFPSPSCCSGVPGPEPCPTGALAGGPPGLASG